MGEAKRRGTFEKRMELALARRAAEDAAAEVERLRRQQARREARVRVRASQTEQQRKESIFISDGSHRHLSLAAMLALSPRVMK